GTKDYAAGFASATPSDKAREFPQFADNLDAMGKEEQTAIEGSLPELHATLDDGVPLAPAAGQGARVEPVAMAAEVDTAEAGNVPEVELEETPWWGAFLGNQGAGTAVRGLSSEAEQGQKKSAIESAIGGMTTADGEVETSPGAPPEVPLQGDADL